jgi:hypothetical protein
MCAAIVLLMDVSPGSGQEVAEPPGSRARVIAALERLMLTGDPMHVEHGAGAWLQAAVDEAFARGDKEIERLAQRAASPLLARTGAPVASIQQGPSFELRRFDVLTLPRPVTYTAEVYASLDGGEFSRIGDAPAAGAASVKLPARASAAGLHHLRLQARITYTGTGSIPPMETRDLPELTYALYDPERNDPFDARLFLQSPGGVRARRFDAELPDELFSEWLNGVLARHSTKPPKVDWLGRYCDERTIESGAPSSMRALCSVAYFEARGVIGQIWMRTGRIELGDRDVRWLAEAPSFEGLKLSYSASTDFDDLSALPALLESDPNTWPRPDVSVAPEDIIVTRVGSSLQISATVRNNGLADVRGVQVYLAASVHGEHGAKRSVVVDVPRRGQVEIKQRLPFSAPYGTVVVHALQLSEHNPFDSWHADPTPEDAVAFRIVNPGAAPPDYAARIVKDCGGICRGY